MPNFSPVSNSVPPARVAPHTRRNSAEGFDNVSIGNGALPVASAAARSPQSQGGVAGFALRRSPSVDTLDSLQFGPTHDDTGLGGGLGLDDGAGGDGVQRADYPNQIARSHPLDPGNQSPTYQCQHGQDLAHELPTLLQAWDQQAAAISGLGAPRGPTPPDALFSRQQTEASTNSREHCARTVLARLGVGEAVVETLLRRHARTEGATAILDACRLLSMPELLADPKAHAKLEKQLKVYLRAARGDYTGVYRAFSYDSHKELDKLKKGIDNTVYDTIGYSVVKDRLLADLAPALVHALARKNPGMSSEALRGQLPNLINTQAFSALRQRMNNSSPSGLLQDAPLLPQFVESAEEAKPPPAAKAADPVNDFVKHLVSVLGAIKPPTIHIENNARQVVNQDGWNFQGNRDPRPERAVDTMPLPIKTLSEVDDTDAESIDEGIDMSADDDAEVEVEVDNVSLNEEDVETREVPPDQERDDPPLRTPGRFGAPVHPLHGSLMSDLINNARYQRVAEGGAHPNLGHLLAVHPDRTEEEEDATTHTHRERTATSAGRVSDDYLRRPIPPGLHVRDMPELQRDERV
ncbi:hypothetical protein [Stenotrophomonas sp. SORGH_AS_0321]|uniref:hypothetical protein n=1 Tax=Stenotrophomonas sp. SORGH_AS_0321 TaxID=3041787 RepID=UPI002867048C|nr:hypothetical protein [Stenotrophomonas sp. SORGH_AS_0321]MDR6092756.1 hypothetical protein [Stenotrophomonas sp. SORGH_AS_0321]